MAAATAAAFVGDWVVGPDTGGPLASGAASVFTAICYPKFLSAVARAVALA